MELLPTTKMNDLLDAYPFLLDFLADYNPKFKLLKNRAMRASMGRMASLAMAAELGGISRDRFLSDIADEIAKHEGAQADAVSEQSPESDSDKVAFLKDIIMDLHKGTEFKEVKARFDQLMSEIEPSQIARMEEQLIREGMPAEEIQRLCDLHVTVFHDALEKQEPVKSVPGHPVHTFMEENKAITAIVSELDPLVTQLASQQSGGGIGDIRDSIVDILGRLAKVDIHYIRKENQLFPYLEKHEISGPSQVMWGIHDEIRVMIKDVIEAVSGDNAAAVVEKGPALSRAVIEMIYKENTILYPMAIDALSEEEWIEIRRGEDEVGYCFVTPGTEWPEGGITEDSEVSGSSLPGKLNLDTGQLSLEQINCMMKHLPVEISFVDDNDELRYYSDTTERVFPRSPGIIGRKVQQCHPPKSVDTVERILDSFKSGKKDSAAFWIDMQGRKIQICYYAVRSDDGKYMGTMEVTQDITDIMAIEGERRLLDWENN